MIVAAYIEAFPATAPAPNDGVDDQFNLTVPNDDPEDAIEGRPVNLWNFYCIIMFSILLTM